MHLAKSTRPLISELVVKSGAKLYTVRQGENMLERAYIEKLCFDRTSKKAERKLLASILSEK